MSMKKSNYTIGNRLVAQYLNQLRHRVHPRNLVAFPKINTALPKTRHCEKICRLVVKRRYRKAGGGGCWECYTKLDRIGIAYGNVNKLKKKPRNHLKILGWQSKLHSEDPRDIRRHIVKFSRTWFVYHCLLSPFTNHNYLFEIFRGQFDWDKLKRKSTHLVGYSRVKHSKSITLVTM
jgi:hypothetical protein